MSPRKTGLLLILLTGFLGSLLLLLKPGATKLIPGQAVLSRATSDETQRYGIDLESNQLPTFSIHPRGGNLRAVATDPAGEIVMDRLCPGGSETSLSWKSETSGSYGLHVSLWSDVAAGSDYSLTMDPIRAALPEDIDRLDALASLAQGDRLAAQGGENRSKAVESYQNAFDLWMGLGDLSEAARALRRLGRQMRLEGDQTGAAANFRRAIEIFRGQGLRLEESRALNDLSEADLATGNSNLALQSAEEALQISRTIDDRHEEARALNNIGEVHYVRGSLRKALDNYEQALEIWRGLGDVRGLAQTLMYLGYSLSDLGESQKALANYQNASGIWRSLGETRQQAISMVSLARLESRLGNFQRSLDLFLEAQEILEPIGDPEWEASIFNGLGYVYEGVGQWDKAVEHYDRAVKGFRAAGLRNATADNLQDLGRGHFRAGKRREALETLTSALEESRAMNDRRLESYVLTDLTWIHQILGENEKALDLLKEALASHRAENDFRAQAVALNLMAGLLLDRGEIETAYRQCLEALPYSQMAQDRRTEAQLMYNLARIAQRRGRWSESVKHIQEAISLAEGLRASVERQRLRISYYSTTQPLYRFYVDLLMQPDSPRVGEAFEISEKVRARSLVESLPTRHAEIGKGIDSRLLQQEKELRMRLDRAEQAGVELMGGAADEKRAATYRAELERLVDQYQELRARIRSANPRYSELTEPQPLNIEQIQEQALDEDTMLLEYLLGPDASYLWAVTKSSIHGYRLPSRAQIESAALKFYDALTAPSRVDPEESSQDRRLRLDRSASEQQEQAAILSRILLGPVASQLKHQRLLVVAEGALQYVPFAALPYPADASSNDAPPRPLIFRHEIVSLPSASTLAALRREFLNRPAASRALAVLADPVFSRDDRRVSQALPSQPAPPHATRAGADAGLPDFGRLPHSRGEAEAIVGLGPPGSTFMALDFDASREGVLAAGLKEYRVVHFATHGVIDNQQPELSGLVLSLVDEDGNPQNGFLRLHEIYSLDLSAELVVLSACQTALGEEIQGEGLIGLSRGFMYAGAERVLASLWKVEDRATAELMRRFYAALFNRGLSPAAALRQAQLSMLTGNNPQWRDPFYWAGFVMQGEYR